MSDTRLNALGQPIGWPVLDWKQPARPTRADAAMIGTSCRLEPLAAHHAAALYAANATDTAGRMWTYLPYGPFANEGDYRKWVDSVAAQDDPLFYAIVDASTNAATGVASFLRIDPEGGCIEVGHIAYSPRLSRTRAATETMYLMMKRAFDLGYRRYEWKCDALNAPSRAAAQRLGFSYEGIFRHARVYKNRNRDTAWFAVVDADWPALDRAFRTWLAPANFDENDRQRLSLSALTRPVLVRLDEG